MKPAYPSTLLETSEFDTKGHTMRVGINGMGRIGRLALRAAMGAAERPADDPRAGNRLEVVHLNELKGGAAATAHLLEFDSVQGRWRADIAAEGEHAHPHRRAQLVVFVACQRPPRSPGATWASTWCWNAPASS